MAMFGVGVGEMGMVFFGVKVEGILGSCGGGGGGGDVM